MKEILPGIVIVIALLAVKISTSSPVENDEFMVKTKLK